MSEELKDARFGDVRLSKRLLMVAEQLAAKPDASFPKAAGSDAALEGTYRFLSHDDVTPERILEPHIAATTRRAAAERVIIAAHDTTEFRFGGDREGLGWINTSGAQGFFGHFALALTADGTRRPLGVIGMQIVMRHGAPKNTKHSERRAPSDRESLRWHELAAEVGNRLREHARVIHVMDREADSYRLFAQLIAAGDGFVIRMRSDRRIVAPEPASFRVDERMAKAEELFVRKVPLSTRKPRADGRPTRHTPRSARMAKLGFSAVKLTILRPDHEREPLPPSLTLNVIRVFEVDAPADVEPVEWTLMTTEPIDTFDQVATAVDMYRARWVIEEFFKALKTGCAFEARQLESSHALLNALAIFAPIAWHLLVLRRLGRDDSPLPASAVLNELQLRILHRKTKMEDAPTIRQAMLAVAQLGGHIKNNGDPGWLVLGRGYEELLILEEGARAVLEM
jgi:transposase-like protein/DDE family transposase